MSIRTSCIFLVWISFSAQAQWARLPNAPEYTYTSQHDIQSAKAKLFQRNYGMIGGLQWGKYTFLDLGTEVHWRKVSLFKPRLISATANMEYNFSNQVLGYKVGAWVKRGRINLTYGANLSYYTDFTYNKFGVGPSVGFRLVGFHLISGFNFFFVNEQPPPESNDEKFDAVNPLYVALRYYFPVDNKFNWKKKNKNKKRKKNEKKRRSRKGKDEPKKWFWQKNKD